MRDLTPDPFVAPVTGEVLPDGEVGELVFTSPTEQAIPVVRHRTRGLTRLQAGTARTMRRMEKVTGRADDTMVVRGVNVFPTQVEELVLQTDGLAPHSECVLTRPGRLDELTLRVEARDPSVDPEVLPRSHGRAQRVRDLR